MKLPMRGFPLTQDVDTGTEVFSLSTCLVDSRSNRPIEAGRKLSPVQLKVVTPGPS